MKSPGHLLAQFILLLCFIALAIVDPGVAQKPPGASAANATGSSGTQTSEESLPGEDGDLDINGPCESDIKMYCSKVRPGKSHIAECIQNQIEDVDLAANEFSAQVTEKCKKNLLEYKMKLATNIDLDAKMRDVCKNDAKTLCDHEPGDAVDDDMPGKVVACLRERKGNLSKKCAEAITEAQRDAAEDYRLDAAVYHACAADAKTFCPETPGRGRVNACLRKNSNKISWDCRAELFTADIENADDIRFSFRLFETCLSDKQKFCPDVAPGNSRAKDCLEEHREESGFSPQCKSMIEDMMEERAADYRLDVNVRRECQVDIGDLCKTEASRPDKTRSHDGFVLNCLQDFRNEIEPSCKSAITKVIDRGSDDIMFATTLAKVCKADREKYCRSVHRGSARVIRCLQDVREQLSEDCKSTLFQHETMMSENIDYNKPLRKACEAEIDANCSKVYSGYTRVIRCLQNGDRKTYRKACRQELEHLEKNMSRDYRLNTRLKDACDKDTQELCLNVCSTTRKDHCAGLVLRCLVDNKQKIKAQECKQEVLYFVKMEVKNFGNDVILAEHCRDDVNKLCSEELKGAAVADGRVHQCLRSHRDELSPMCRSEELKLEIEQAGYFDLRTNLKKACATERQVFCGDVTMGGARVFRCLVHNLGKGDFGDACHSQVMAKLMRRQHNWKLDVTLRNECTDDVAKLCSTADHDSDHANVTRCLISHFKSLSATCKQEVSRAVYMSLFVWQPEAPLSKVCDTDVKKCTTQNPLLPKYPGLVLDCLSGKAETISTDTTLKSLAPECKQFVNIASPPDTKQEFDGYFQEVAQMKMRDKLVKAGMWDRRSGVTISGYTALACFSALCTSVVMGLTYAYRRWKGGQGTQYVQVVKQGDKNGGVG